MKYFKLDHLYGRFFCSLLLLLGLFALGAQAATVHGTITDSLGALIPKASVELIANQKVIASTTADSAVAGGAGGILFSSSSFSSKCVADDPTSGIPPTTVICWDEETPLNWIFTSIGVALRSPRA